MYPPPTTIKLPRAGLSSDLDLGVNSDSMLTTFVFLKSDVFDFREKTNERFTTFMTDGENVDG